MVLALQEQGDDIAPFPELLSDAEILSSIRSTMTRKQTMSLPLHLLKGNPSLDALENALRAESIIFPRTQSVRRRMASGTQVRLNFLEPILQCMLWKSSHNTATYHVLCKGSSFQVQMVRFVYHSGQCPIFRGTECTA